MAKQTLEEFWEEDAARVEEMCVKAQELGVVEDVLGDDAEPPPLNEDGSLVEDEDE